MDTTTVIRMVFLILVFSLILRGVFLFFRSIKRANARSRKEYEAYQHGLDDQLRAAGHTEEYLEKAKTIRGLQAKRREAKIGYYAAWIDGIICLFVFPPLGIFLTGFAIIITIREGRKLRKEMRETAYEFKDVRQSMPEK